MRRNVTRSISITAGVILGLLLVYALLGYFAAPRLIHRTAVQYAEQYGITLALDRVRVNPFLLTVDLYNARVELDGKAPPALEAQRLHLDLGLSSLLRRALVFERVRLDGATLRLVRGVDGKTNFAGLARRETVDEAEANTADIAAVILQSVELEAARIEYLDRSLPADGPPLIATVNLTAQDVSTMDGSSGSYELAATIADSATLKGNGSLTLVPLASKGSLQLSGLHAATLAQHLLSRSAEASGEFAATLRYEVAAQAGDITATAHELTASAVDLVVKPSAQAQPVLQLARVDVEGGYVATGAHRVTLKSVRAARGSVHAKMDADGNFDLLGLLRDFPQQLRDPDTAQWRVSVGTFALEQIAVAYSQQAGALPFQAQVGAVDARLSAEATLGEEATAYAVNDIAFELKDVSARSTGAAGPSLRLRGVNLDGGHIDSRTRRIEARKLALADGSLVLTRDALGNVELAPASRRPDRGDARTFSLPIAMVALATAAAPRGGQADIEDSRLPQPWSIDVQNVSVRKVGLRYADSALAMPVSVAATAVDAHTALSVVAGGNTLQLQLNELGAEFADIAIAELGARQPAIALRELKLLGGTFDLRKQVVTLEQVGLGGLTASMWRNQAGVFKLGLPGADAAPAKNVSSASAVVAPARPPVAPPWQITVGRLNADGETLRFADHTQPTPLRAAIGKFQLQTSVAVNSGGSVPAARLSGLNATVSGITASGPGNQQGVRIGQFGLRGFSVDTVEWRIAADGITLANANIPVVADAAGNLLVGGMTLSSGAEAAAADASSPSWQYRVATATIDDVGVEIATLGLTPPLRHALQLDATIDNLRSGAESPVKYAATVTPRAGGTLQIKGTAAQSWRTAQARLQLAGLALEPYEPLLAQVAALDIVAGTASGNLDVQYSAQAEPLVQARGELTASDVRINEAGTSTRFAAWRTITAQGIDLTLKPNQLDIAQVLLRGPEATLTVSEKRNLNISRVLRNDAGEDATDSRSADVFPLRIRRVEISEGELEFADNSLVLPFSTQVHALQGVIVGIATAPGSRAELSLEGTIADYGTANASGALDPMAPTDFTDITVRFNNVSIPPFSPYTATFAGRKIESGRVWLDLDYRIVKQQLSGENKIVVQNLKLGERVEAPGAADLPLELAIALLKDKNGRISMEIPVSGDVGNAEFDYGGVIRQAIAGALKRVITAPFRAIASLFGNRKPEDLQNVAFEPGSDRLPTTEHEQLQQVAQALAERPALDVQIHAFYDAERDARALRTESIRRQVAATLGNQARGERADPIAYSDPRAQQALEELARTTLDELQFARWQQAREPDARDRYRALFEQLVDGASLPTEQLETLAQGRATAIADELVAQGIAADRVKLAQPRAADRSSNPSIAARLELAASSSR